MSNSKQKQSAVPATRSGTTLAGKLAAMAANDTTSIKDTPEKDNPDNLSMSQLVSELAKQRVSLKEDMASLIQESIKPLQVSVDTLRETVSSFQQRLASTEVLVGENFERLVSAEATIKSLKAQNLALLDQIDDIENRSRRANLRIINVPEGAEDGKDTIGFISGLLKDTMESVFDKPPELERAHRALRPKPGAGQYPRPFIVCFHRFQEKEKALHWARRHDIKFNGESLRLYPDTSAALAKKRAGFKEVKHSLYQKGIKFQLLYPARLRVRLGEETPTFDSPEAAESFYKQRILIQD